MGGPEASEAPSDPAPGAGAARVFLGRPGNGVFYELAL